VEPNAQWPRSTENWPRLRLGFKFNAQWSSLGLAVSSFDWFCITSLPPASGFLHREVNPTPVRLLGACVISIVRTYSRLRASSLPCLLPLWRWLAHSWARCAHPACMHACRCFLIHLGRIFELTGHIWLIVRSLFCWTKTENPTEKQALPCSHYLPCAPRGKEIFVVRTQENAQQRNDRWQRQTPAHGK
jgi:hypothetical protein